MADLSSPNDSALTLAQKLRVAAAVAAEDGLVTAHLAPSSARQIAHALEAERFRIIEVERQPSAWDWWVAAFFLASSAHNLMADAAWHIVRMLQRWLA